ncbi:ankyrin repeat, PH and SEC7 domain containing protein secG-like [Saccostrea echinata]|uniref:ankyrin repeat, PH and SEC7 domain containing protein secG-like n=1 Tax=Saccostrea echinata TaxID=191078 RepID=UPI002A80EE93|nr:ankyrin repeat, PH and SEC7 domain containing protein secG-like [Saccostrea echinata]
MVRKHSKDFSLLFVRTRAYDKTKELLDTNGYVVIKVNPGTGKTTIAKILMKEFMKERKSSIQFYKITDLYENISPSDGIVVFIDNLFGELSLSNNDVQQFTAASEMVKVFIEKDTDNESNRFIFTIRNDIYQDFVSNGNDDFFLKSSIVDLSSEPYALQKEEILQLASRYNLSKYIDDEELISKVSLMPISIGFPQCCKLAQNAGLKEDVSALLMNPVKCLRDYLTKCLKSPTAKTAVLFYILLSGGQVDFEFINSLHLDLEMKRASIELIGLHKSCINDFQDSIDSFDGFLTVRNRIKNSITFSHSSVQESLFNVLFYLDPPKIIQNCHHSLLLTITTSKNPSNTQVVKGEKAFDDVAQRIANIIANAQGSSALHSVASSGDKHAFNLLLNFGFDPYEKGRDSGHTVLTCACQAGRLDMVKYLTEKYPDLIHHHTDHRGDTLFHWAAFCGKVNMFEYLLNLFEDENVISLLASNIKPDIYEKNKLGKSILHTACFEGHYDMCMYLLSKYPPLLNVCDKHGRNVLHSAASGGNVDIFQYLTSKGLDIVPTANGGETVLHTCCKKGRENMCTYLNNKYQHLIREKDSKGLTVLHSACQGGSVEIVSFLLKQGLEIDTLANGGQSILHVACLYGKFEVCEYLIVKHPYLLDVKDKFDLTVLHYAALGGNVQIVRLLTEKDLLEIRDKKGWTAFHLASYVGALDVLKFLIKKDIDITLEGNWGENVLHIACLRGHLNVCEFLMINYPELLYKKDFYGRTIFQYAADGEKWELLQYLVDLGIDFSNGMNKSASTHNGDDSDLTCEKTCNKNPSRGTRYG